MTDALMVELPELRGYSRYLDHLTSDLGRSEALVSSHCVDADFGKIVEDLASDYAALLPQLKQLLAENETVMGRYAVAVDSTAADYERTDDGIASRFEGDGIGGGSGTNAFSDTSAASTATPHATESELPEVSFGFAFNKLAWALEKFTGWDVRAEVTDWIAGDVVAMSTQASCWEIVGDRMGSTRTNLSDAGARVGRTWEGRAASDHVSSSLQWNSAFEEQAEGYKKLGEALRDLAKEAVHVAQLVVDCIRLAIDLILSAWSLMYIPVVGQARFIKKAYDAYKRANKAIAYLKMIASAIRFTKSLMVVLVDSLTPTKLPAVPAGV